MTPPSSNNSSSKGAVLEDEGVHANILSTAQAAISQILHSVHDPGEADDGPPPSLHPIVPTTTSLTGAHSGPATITASQRPPTTTSPVSPVPKASPVSKASPMSSMDHLVVVPRTPDSTIPLSVDVDEVPVGFPGLRTHTITLPNGKVHWQHIFGDFVFDIPDPQAVGPFYLVTRGTRIGVLSTWYIYLLGMIHQTINPSHNSRQRTSPYVLGVSMAAYSRTPSVRDGMERMLIAIKLDEAWVL
ncbi:hypothetical protein PAXINDRAFT_17233 [Paxillus involutus ATCC 200175]|uniref:Uncharacterized protein n=1 Tax=Paxillus involutus ATCC 200175 TaxID=664439 RepID=A0A0C9SQL9_PAXIN|nr:hypothetical protein PAXINDRAFT_17233 [Paxillus involutus ATCC 200175]